MDAVVHKDNFQILSLFQRLSMETHHNAFAAPLRVATDGLEVLTDWEQPQPTGYASPDSTFDWGIKCSSLASRTSSWDSDASLR